MATYLILQLINSCNRTYASFTKITPDSTSQDTSKTTTGPHYRLDTDSSAIFTLPDGRELGYAQYGSHTGNPIFYCHGIPGSRMEAAAFDDHAVKFGARIIAVDRPGIGWSSPHPNRTMLDHAKDIGLLAERLHLKEYGVLGISGGGPYALASAASLPTDKLKAVSVVCGLGSPDMPKTGMNWLNWFGFTVVHRHFSPLARWWIKRDVAARSDLSDDERFQLLLQQFLSSNPHRKDLELLGDGKEFQLYLRSMREHLAQGVNAFSQDGKVLSSDFGFRIQDIRRDLPIKLWYGKLDTNVPLIHGEETARRLGDKAQLRVEDETHASLVVNWRDQILRDLVSSMRGCCGVEEGNKGFQSVQREY